MEQFFPRAAYTVKAANWTLTMGERTLVMGILNVTPDSFSDKGRYYGVEASVRRAWEIAEEPEERSFARPAPSSAAIFFSARVTVGLLPRV
jgi:hypothetical protein